MGVDRVRSWLADFNGERFIKLNNDELAVQRYLRERARQASPHNPRAVCITYGDLCKAIDPDERIWKHPRYKGIGRALGHVSFYEHHHGRPLLSALVVLAATGDPGDGFVEDLCRGTLQMTIAKGQEHGFWLSTVEEVVRFWNDPDSMMASVDSLFDLVLDELTQLKRRLDASGNPS